MFIAFEGIDGTGKSTTIQMVADKLKTFGKEVVIVKTPGGTPEGIKIRELLLNPASDLDQKATTLLFLTDMIQVSEKVILPALDRGAIVLCDRFFGSTIVYQLSSLPENVVSNFLPIIGLLPQPDLTFILDLPIAEAMKRVQKRDKKSDRYEEADEQIWHFRANAFRKAAALTPNMALVNALFKTPYEVTNEIISEIAEAFLNLDAA